MRNLTNTITHKNNLKIRAIEFLKKLGNDNPSQEQLDLLVSLLVAADLNIFINDANNK